MKDMNDKSIEQIELFVQETAVQFEYPTTPDFTSHSFVREQATRSPVTSPKLAWALAMLALVLAGLFMVPQVRAAVLRIFQAGAITIFQSEGDSSQPQGENSQSFTPFMSEFGETVTLLEAQDKLRNSIFLPKDLAEPNQFIVDSAEAPTMLVSLWLDGDAPEISLYQIEVANFAAKGADIVVQTQVNGQDAFWIEGPHVIRLEDGSFESWLFVEGNVLIWWQGELTFRLEGAETFEEAIAIAKSLAEIPVQK